MLLTACGPQLHSLAPFNVSLCISTQVLAHVDAHTLMALSLCTSLSSAEHELMPGENCVFSHPSGFFVPAAPLKPAAACTRVCFT